jgi:hypothetical protein
MAENAIELQKALKGAKYPASRDALVECARSNGASAALVDTLEHVERYEFGGPEDVEKAVFKGK